MTYLSIPIQNDIWNSKYRFEDDRTIEDTWRRVATALAMAEKGMELQERWNKNFYGVLEGFKFLPAGRVIAGAGTGRKVTLFNCFVLATVPDSMDGIFSVLKDGALTMQQGGGIGTDFSTIRPKGESVKGVGADASGPLTFMDCWDSMCRTVMSAGWRRGAMMGTLRVDHPDIEAFIEAKRDPLRFRMFNLSVLVTDDFMKRVKSNQNFDLVFGGKTYKVVSARELWHKIMRSAYDSAEPGVIFIDRINKTNNLKYCEKIAATNPCAEQPLPPNGACLLGSINLTAFVANPFKTNVMMDTRVLRQTVRTAVRMLDNVIDVSNYPLPEQKEEAIAKRRIGLGITGLADALAMHMLYYGDEVGRYNATEWMKTIATEAYAASVDLAVEKEPFPLFTSEHGKGALGEYREGCSIRNSHLLSIAPTGTISLLAGNVSSGIEPIYEWDYTRKILNPDGSKRSEVVEDYAVRLYRSMFPGEEMPDYFHARHHELTPTQHLLMQAALQPYVDTSISKTLNCPKDISFYEFQDIYTMAYDAGLKCVSVFRPNDITGSVLSAAKPEPEKPEEIISGNNEQVTITDESVKVMLDAIHALPQNLASREHALVGKTYKIKWFDHAVYITINDHAGSPFEIFINSKALDHYAWTVGLTRMISAIFRRGGDISFVVEELKAIFDPKGGMWKDGRYIPSLLAAIGEVIEMHINKTSYQLIAPAPESIVSLTGLPIAPTRLCPKCSSANVIFPKANCLECRDCNWSNCQ